MRNSNNSNKNKAYSELDEKLKIHLENSTNDVHIDEDAKNKIWNNLSKEIHEEQLKKKFRVRRTYKAVVTACIVIVALVSVDLSSNASLFKRLLTSVSGNIIQLHSRDSKPYEENRDPELDAKVAEINEINGKNFISPIIPENYTVKNINDNGNMLVITMVNNDNNILRIREKEVSKSETGTTSQYNQNQYDVETFNNNGIEYTMLKSENFNIGIFVKGDVEFEVIGIDYSTVFDTTLSLQN
ncbi:DUF4367 domain-containing protein [Vallitalea sp.]|jgi:predicted small metal-binding protein|uniref:DUF4367 domain-containing protein n=1 Tax=Vallitalea sp. TaxID=1882829 RepID=UPI0025E60E93|nr:DUF4367 domain-containing protein [Vallitalea sp.]MCT4685825.1 DUF4367 domain-containing protein [Vallitalea sp.]